MIGFKKWLAQEVLQEGYLEQDAGKGVRSVALVKYLQKAQKPEVEARSQK